MITLTISQKTDNNKVFITETNTSSQKQRSYIADADKADKFIQQRRNIEMNKKFQNVMSGFVAGLTGFYTNMKVKSHPVAAGCLAALATFAAFKLFDNWFDNFLQKQNMKKNGVKELDIIR